MGRSAVENVNGLGFGGMKNSLRILILGIDIIA